MKALPSWPGRAWRCAGFTPAMWPRSSQPLVRAGGPFSELGCAVPAGRGRAVYPGGRKGPPRHGREWSQFAVALRATGQLIGDCAAMPQADDPRQCEIGFTIAPDHQGRGYATEAVRLLVGYLFTGRGKHRITAYCDARNAASAALLERLGMRREGHLRESSWAKGEWTDDLVYGLLRDEWQPGSW